MKKFTVLLLIVFIISACSGKNPSSTSDSTSGLPTPIVGVTPAPDVAATVDQYLGMWNESNYAGMYAMLSQTSKDAVSETDFTKLYGDTTAALTLDKIDFGIISTLVKPASAKVGYQINYNTNLFGIISRSMEMDLVIESGEWRIQWQESLIIPELAGGNRLVSNIRSPSRGEIYDRNGENVLVNETQAVALGVIPSEIAPEYENSLLDLLSVSLKMPKNVVGNIYKNSADWYLPIGEISQSTYEERANSMARYSGLVTNPYTSRYYYNGGVAPHVLGYMRSIFPEEVDEYKRQGYSQDAKIGAAGLELWGEQYLVGRPAADLYVVKPDGTYETRLASIDPKAADTLYVTYDKDFQILVQKALLGFTGAIVVMEVDTGRILAMASTPGFDPNLMQQENYNFQYGYNAIISDTETTPLWNRAIQSSYPLGSVFKLVTAAAALESGLYTPNSTYECTSQFTELPGFVGNDWTFDKDLPPSGNLTLLEGLMRSCNPWFYHLGLELYREKGATYLSDMARGFGLGSATGIIGLQEDAGSINDPADEGAAVQMGIGQGDMLVTPIQVVDFIAAIANGGTLYQPQVVEKITSLNGDAVQSFKPIVRGTLPVSQETLVALKEGMRMVVEEERGTAHSTFVGMETPIFGKTGTATTSIVDPHSWFAGFTDANLPDKPDIAIVVIAENAGDGSKIAAPIFKRVIQDYFTGEPQSIYPWEFDYYLTKTPAQTDTVTP